MEVKDSQEFMSWMCQLEDGIVIVDSDGEIFHLNTKATKLLNLPADSKVNFLTYIKKEFTIENGEPALSLDAKFTLYRPETEIFNALYLFLQVYQYPCFPDKYMIIVKDETEKRLQSLLQNEFLTMISHKLRTPIVALSYAMNLVQRKKELQFSENEINDFISQAYLKSFEISEIVEKLIRFSSVLKDKAFSGKESIDLEAVLEDVKEKYHRKYKSIRPAYEILVEKKAESTEVAIPHEYVTIVMESLIDNACKFHLEKKAEILITIGPAEGSLLHVTVKDNGPGIPAEMQDRIFEPFFQIDKYCSGTVDGIGLGLPLVKHILDVYGQKISVESQIDKGTTVSFTLPLKKD